MLRELHRIIQDVNRAPDLDAALRLIVLRVRDTMAVDVCSVYLTESDSKRHLLMATEGLQPKAVGQVSLATDEGLVGHVATRAETLSLEDAQAHPRFKFFADSGEEPYHGFVGVPVIYQRHTLGVLVVQQKAHRRFDEEDVAFLVTLAAQLAGAIAHAKASGALSSLGKRGSGPALILDGQPGAPGVVVGPGVVIYPPADLDAVPDRQSEDTAAEMAALTDAVTRAREELDEITAQMGSSLPTEERALFDAYAMMISSEGLMRRAREHISSGNWAPGALRASIEEYAQRFETMDDPYLRQRASDIRDIGVRLLGHLQDNRRGPSNYPPGTILVGESLSPFSVAEAPPGHLAGVISGRGTSTSHLAILAHALGIPAAVGVQPLPLKRLDGKELVIDGYRGRVYVEPDAAVRSEFRRLATEEKRLNEELAELRDLPAETKDGQRVPLYVNSALLADVAASADIGADGIGLYRTEFPFMVGERFPTEEEQRLLYRQVLEAFAPRPVTLRTLDVGGDKPLSYFPINEDNALLGWRGIRISLDQPDIFLTQLRAAMRAAEGLGNLRIMLPMISGADELDEALGHIQQTYRSLNEAGLGVDMPPVGLLIEVPSAVYQAASLAARVDFLSIGTNDLTQYLLAVDRNNERVGALYDSLHPAVIRAVLAVVEAGKQAGRPVGVCGEAAGDPAAALLLLGIGVDNLSASPGNLPRVKQVVRSFTRTQAQQLLAEALELDRTSAVRGLMTQALDDAGLGRLVRGGA